MYCIYLLTDVTLDIQSIVCCLLTLGKGYHRHLVCKNLPYFSRIVEYAVQEFFGYTATSFSSCVRTDQDRLSIKFRIRTRYFIRGTARNVLVQCSRSGHVGLFACFYA